MPSIVIVEDEPRVARILEKGLQASGYGTAVAGDGRSALALVESGAFDLLLLDLGLPDQDGLDVLSQVRRTNPDLPVIILTGRHEAEDTVAALEGGADDYVTKPFRLDELLARIRARLRAPWQAAEAVLTAGDVELDLLLREARVGGRKVPLSTREFALAEVFLRHPHQVLSRQQLLWHVWGYDVDPASNVVDVYVGYLRRKLGADVIVTVRGVGYTLGGGPPARSPEVAEHGPESFETPRPGRPDAANRSPEARGHLRVGWF